MPWWSGGDECIQMFVWYFPIYDDSWGGNKMVETRRRLINMAPYGEKTSMHPSIMD